LPVHNEALVDDELTTIQFNHEWRRIVASALTYYFRDYETDLGLDNEDLFNSVLVDLYNAETFTVRKYTARNQDIVSNQTQLNGTSATVANSSFPHTFEYPNAIIRCWAIALSGSLAGTTSTALIVLSGEATDSRADAMAKGTTARELVAVAKYSGLPTGVEKTISLTLGATGGQATINANSILLFEIEEWD
jgi:DNA-binding protein Fis